MIDYEKLSTFQNIADVYGISCGGDDRRCL